MRSKILLLPFFTLLWAKGHSQLNISPLLQDAVLKAISKSSVIKNNEIEHEKIALEKKSVLNKYIPKVEASATYLYFDSKIKVDLPATQLPITGIEIFEGKSSFDNYGNLFNGSIMAKTVLYSGGQIENGAKALEQKLEAEKQLTEVEKQNIAKEVISSFDALFLLDEIDNLINESEKRLATETHRVEKAISEGLAIPYDREKIKLAHLELQASRIEVEGKRKVLYKKINYLTGYSQDEIVKVKYELSPLVISEDLSVNDKQELKALESYKKASDFLVKKEKGTYLPAVGAFGGLTYLNLFNASTIIPKNNVLTTPVHARLNSFALSPALMVGVSAKWEIFGGFERKHKVEEAKLASVQVQNKIDDTRDKLNLLLENNLSTYRSANEKYQVVLQKELVAKNNLNMAIRQYQEGLINITERLATENDMIKTGTEKVQTIIDQRRTVIETLSGTGTLLTSVITK
ncbi:TolC family protein [Polluticaenibacter yanchengensis]|uniref:TolC family protein n=1 Tax=Polluticaenibacter yanchengensis TaxID=3014562 RepID=A0ABT4UIH7_9BACT|nr:TolC family protein [Chitinophagaceae bacterium LY-5]